MTVEEKERQLRNLIEVGLLLRWKVRKVGVRGLERLYEMVFWRSISLPRYMYQLCDARKVTELTEHSARREGQRAMLAEEKSGKGS